MDLCDLSVVLLMYGTSAYTAKLRTTIPLLCALFEQRFCELV